MVIEMKRRAAALALGLALSVAAQMAVAAPFTLTIAGLERPPGPGSLEMDGSPIGCGGEA